MNFRTLRLVLIAGLAVLASSSMAACGVGLGCTLIGCTDDIVLTVNNAGGTALANFSGSVIVNGTTIAVTCDATTRAGTGFRCPVAESGLVLTSVTADRIHVTLTPEGGTTATDTDVTVTTTTSQPNGPNCPPICRQGRGTVTLQ